MSGLRGMARLMTGNYTDTLGGTTVEAASVARDSRTGGRLLRRTFLISLLLVSIGLVVSGAVELFFSYKEKIAALGELQREIAQGAAFKIQQFVDDIEKTMRATTQTQGIVTNGLTQDFRFELIKLLKVAPAITEVVAVNINGKEEIKVSRVRTTLPDDLKNRSADPVFVNAKSGKSFFSKVYFVRKSEPYMTIAVPIERFAGEVIGVLIGEVNLKYIWDVVSGIKVGTAGYAYVVSDDGDLIAHPDISFVLEKRNLKQLGQVKAALAKQAGPLPAQANMTGQKVLPAFASIPDLGWAVLIERPVSEAYAPLYASTLRTSFFLLLGLGMALFASYLIGRRVVGPIEVLRQGAARIGSGDLDHRLEIKTGDELQELADEFNSMAGRLRESYANLEQKVEDRTRELTESLEQQTATSEILQVIASSPTDIQPVLKSIAENAARLCEATDAQVFRVEDHRLVRVAGYGTIPFSTETHVITRATPDGRAVIDRTAVHVDDLAAELDHEFPGSKSRQEASGARTVLAAPLLREGVAIGVINIRRTQVRPFTEKQVQLLQTFADQAVIAIENVRLFQELQERTRELQLSLEEVRALSEVSGAVSSSLDLQHVLNTVAKYAVDLSKCDGCGIFEYNLNRRGFDVVASHNLSRDYLNGIEATTIGLDATTVGRAAGTGAAVEVADISETKGYPFRDFIVEAGFRAVLTIPMTSDEVTRGLVLLRRSPGKFDGRITNLLSALASQSKIAIQNARLFQEIEQKSEQLENANRHKSQFLANVSHELRTPLNSIIGFTRLVLRKTEGQIEKLQKENLQKVLVSSEHLLTLINGLLDLSKIEAGRMEVYAETFILNDVIRVATSTVEPLLKDGRVRLISDVAGDIPPLKTDRDKLKQVVLNLLSNAVKFTEQGEIKVSAARNNGLVQLTVSDTGIGMKKEALDYIFDEFRQADMSSTRRYGGTGLGLAIVKKFVNLMGGDIGVESELGKGSKFTITLPVEYRRPPASA
jgi:signal transduction histidine kinase